MIQNRFCFFYSNTWLTKNGKKWSTAVPSASSDHYQLISNEYLENFEFVVQELQLTDFDELTIILKEMSYSKGFRFFSFEFRSWGFLELKNAL